MSKLSGKVVLKIDAESKVTYDPARSVFAGNLPKDIEVRGFGGGVGVRWFVPVPSTHRAINGGFYMGQMHETIGSFMTPATHDAQSFQDEDVIRFFSDSSVSSDLRSAVEAVRVVRDRYTREGKGAQRNGGWGITDAL